MPEYIPTNAGLIQEMIRAQQQSGANKTQSTRNIAEAVASAIGEHYKDKEMKIQAAKEAKIKESLALLDFAKNFETVKLPPGTQGQVGVEGYQPTPPAYQQLGEFMRPREKQYKPDETIGEAVGKQLGLPPETTVKAANLTLRNKAETNRLAIFNSRSNPDCQALSRQVQGIMSGGIKYEELTAEEQAKVKDWIANTEKLGTNLSEYKKALAAAGGKPEDVLPEFSWLETVKKIVGWKSKPAAKTAPSAATPKPAAKTADNPLGLPF